MSLQAILKWVQFAIRDNCEDALTDSNELLATAASQAADLIRSDFLRKFPKKDWSDVKGFGWSLQTDAPFQATLLYRISHEIFLRNQEDSLLDLLSYAMRVRTGMEIYYSSTIGEGFLVMHGSGLVVGPRHRIGNNFTVYQGVTLGQRRDSCPEETLEIGNDCVVFAGAGVFGKLKIGDRVTVAANAVLLSDAETGGTYAGIPARRIS